MRFPSRLAGTVAICLLSPVLQGCSHSPRPQTASVYPQDLPDRAQLISLMDSFVAAHHTCSVPESSEVPAALLVSCLGPTTIWTVSTDPTKPGIASVSIRQLTATHNEFVLAVQHSSTGWTILSIALIDA